MTGDAVEDGLGFDSKAWAMIEDEELDKKSKYPRKQSRGKNNILVQGTLPYKRETVMKWYGWGYTDSQFYFRNGNVRFSGNRYEICNMNLPYFTQYLKDNFDIVFSDNLAPEGVTMPAKHEFPKSKLTAELLTELQNTDVKLSIEGSDRMVRSHGQGLYELDCIKRQKVCRIPDAVVWPTCHEEVIEVVRVCDKYNMVIIPFGGGTSVSGAVTCPVDEPRPIVSLDTTMMNEILWVDEESLVACCESGIIGQDLERELQNIGYTCGHEPDSIEFSTLGGWVATRASGMKKNKYGNIEDIVVHAKMVTPRGILERGDRVPRVSSGPDFNHVIMGSEGCFGVITEVSIKIRPLPPFKKYGSLVFPNFETGVHFMREVAKQRIQPASIRLLDNDQFLFGRTFRGENTYMGLLLDGLKHLVVTQIKGYNWKEMTIGTLLFEGEKNEVIEHEKKIYSIAAQYKGIPAGETNGRRGYAMTYVIAYIRDVGLELKIYSETLETSIPWDRAVELVEKIKSSIARESIKKDIARFKTMCRVAQTYDAGCCLYFYFGIGGRHHADPVKLIEFLEGVARDEIVAMGGSISHHHGVGKARRKWYEQSVSPVGLSLFKACKAHLDPNNVFATVNFTEDLSINKSKL